MEAAEGETRPDWNASHLIEAVFVTDGDYVAQAAAHSPHRHARLVVMPLVAGAGLLAMWALFRPAINTQAARLGMAPAQFVALLGGVVTAALAWQAVRGRSVRRRQSSPAIEPQRICWQFTEDNATAISPNVTNSFAWQAFARAIVHPQGVILTYGSAWQWTWIPRSAFATVESYADFLDLVRRKIPHVAASSA